MPIQSINPFNGRTLNTYQELSDNQLEALIVKSHDSFLAWRKKNYNFRSSILINCADELEKSKQEYAGIITMEMGKVLKEATAEIEKCAAVCRFYAEKAEGYLQDEPLNTAQGNAYIHYNPLGPVLAVMPWNFPFWQVFRFAAPALMAGNTGLLKHASNVPQCSLAIERVFLKAGAPEGVFQSLMIGSAKVSGVISHPLVKAVTLTGSEEAGSKVAECAGRNIKKSVLELGGSDPYIILEDANLKRAAETAVKARMINAGQSCIAAKRFIIHEKVYEAFGQHYIHHVDKLKKGDPLKQATDFGPMARKDLAEEIHEQVLKSLNMGAELLYGSLPEAIKDAFYPPLILHNIPKDAPAYREELFGPVASFFKCKNDDEAVRIANDSVFGLGASLWTNDKAKARRIASQIESGAVYCNQMMFSDPSVPFGGIKTSGYGRELSHLGIREFTNQKTIWMF